jgi:hypothetical protein
MLYGAISGVFPRRALTENPDTRTAIHAMLRATADQVTRPGAPPGCMLILAAPTGAVENSSVREFLADLRRDGVSRADLEGVVTCAMAAWDTLVAADEH